MKKLFLSIAAAGFIISACKKKDTTNNVSANDSAYPQKNYSDTAVSTAGDTQSIKTSNDSINTKTHVGGRKTSNNNTGNGTGNINAAVSDSAHNLQGRSRNVNKK
ncbi:hypothetical protein J2795_001741 [Chryseobacterium bernardetii]|jgi:hypothetical protein|uniref:Lipoprotein n=3 Tax=Chryseobacterium TaxID=59732 RepID=A0A543EI71_9FLAO|nr:MULTISPECIES: hypothetical protein [Chryseobacterium]MDR6371213.1 hypothetical protein [Chryseobacterium vietnamense]MDR6441041.1 hypothetical protein [Chryseobacterium bernardetii]MDR6457717.1 hypothetical protein [Chryseobacterium vietnamense]MDR6486454.1 hypothetical protein [Chryseobacterium vietnamense]TQM21282.1 hypothetical protein FB551_0965 [Chryseobacterium aquifrigidense]